MFPSLAKLTGNPDEFRSAVLASFSAIAAICLFIGACLSAVAPEFIAVILGRKWLDAVPVFRWLAVFGGISALVLVLEVPLWVVGRTKACALQSWLDLVLIAGFSWFAVRQFGVEGAAASRVVVAVLLVPVMMMLVVRTGMVTFIQLSGAIWRPAAAAVAMYLAVQWVPAGSIHVFAMLVVKVGICVLTYPLSLLALWRLSGRPAGFEQTTLQHAKAVLRRSS